MKSVLTISEMRTDHIGKVNEARIIPDGRRPSRASGAPTMRLRSGAVGNLPTMICLAILAIVARLQPVAARSETPRY